MLQMIIKNIKCCYILIGFEFKRDTLYSKYGIANNYLLGFDLQ